MQFYQVKLMISGIGGLIATLHYKINDIFSNIF